MKKSIIIVTFLIISFFQVLSQEYLTGLVINEAAAQSVPVSTRLLTRNYSSVPSSYSLKQFTPFPGRQGLPSCTGWATAYACRTITKAIADNNTNRNNLTTNAFSPAYIYNQAKLSSNCSDGAHIPNCLKILKIQGCPFNKDYPEICNKIITQEIKRQASSYKITDYRRLNKINGSFIPSIKKAISENKPVIFGMMTYDSFVKDYKGEVWNGLKDNQYGRHAMAVIGYDDEKYGGALEIMNSWGRNWRNNGFVWIRYRDFNDVTFHTYEVIQNLEPKPSPKPEKIILAAEINLVLEKGEKIIIKENTESRSQIRSSKKTVLSYKSNSGYSSGTQYRMYIDNQEPAYVYIFASDLKNNLNLIFPWKNESPLLPYKSNNIALPSEEDYIKLDNTIGTDYLCVLFSKNALNINNILNKIRNYSGNMQKKIASAVNNNVVPFRYIEREKNKISFKGKKNTEGNIIALVIEMEHTE